MAQKSKPSRKQRRNQRQKSVRAEEHGLPARAVERPPARVDRSAAFQRSLAARRPSEDAEQEEESLSGGTEKAAPSSLWTRILAVPTAAKLAVLGVLLVIVLAIVAGQRDRAAASGEGSTPGSAPPQPNVTEPRPSVEAPVASTLAQPEPPAAAPPPASSPSRGPSLTSRSSTERPAGPALSAPTRSVAKTQAGLLLPPVPSNVAAPLAAGPLAPALEHPSQPAPAKTTSGPEGSPPVAPARGAEEAE